MSSSTEKKGIAKPLFILGPERSGTTLLYSILANAEEFYWLSRIDSILPSLPWSAHILRKLTNIVDVKTYSAEYKGVSSMNGINTPSESIPYWRNIFGFGDEENYLVANDLFQAKDVNPEIQQFIYTDFGKRLKYSNRKRLLFKQPGFSLKMEFWNELFEDALFLICVRGIEDNIRSYCKVKESSEEQFWGTKVPGWRDYLQADYRTQTAFQLYQIYSIILGSVEKIESNSSNQVMLIPYERMTSNPAKLLDEVLDFCEVEPNERIFSALENIKKRESEADGYLAKNKGSFQILKHHKEKAKEVLNDSK